jgi:hypothetical protein
MHFPDWMPKNIRFLFEQVIPASDFVVDRIESGAWSGPFWFAYGGLSQRVRNAFSSVVLLVGVDSHPTGPDTAVLLRVMYDAWLQLEFMAWPELSATRSARVGMYWQFSLVDNFAYYENLDRQRSAMGEGSRLRANAEDIERERRLVEEYRGKFENKKGKLRKYWYPGTLRDVARAVGRDTEYVSFVSLLSAATHASPAAHWKRGLWTTEFSAFFALMLQARAVVSTARLFEIPVPDRYAEILRVASNLDHMNRTVDHS